MTKTRLLLVSLLLVAGLGVLAPNAAATLPSGASYASVTPTLYWVRANGGAESVGPLAINFFSGVGTVDGSFTFAVKYSQPIVGAASIGTPVVADFCSDTDGNAYCGTISLTVSGNNTLQFKTGPAPVGGLIGKTITFYGVRINVIGLAIGTNIYASIIAQLDNTDPIYFGTGSTPPREIDNIPVGYVAGYAITVTAPVDCASGEPISAGSMLTCKAFEAYQRHHGRKDDGGSGFSILVTENWSGAWTSLSDEFKRAPFAPNVGNTVTNGSNISITVTGIPQGVTVTPEAPGIPSGCTTCAETWGPTPSAYTGLVWDDSHTFEFPITYELGTETESAIFCFEISTSGLITPDDPNLAISVTLDPHTNSTTTPPSDGTADYPWFYYATGQEEEAGPLSVFKFIDCETSLLFTYVTNYSAGAGAGALGNWDTFINIANATSDPFMKGSAIPQDGSCTFYVYNAGQVASEPAGGPVERVPITFTGPIQLSGGEFGTDLAGTPAAGVVGAYVIVVCEFLNATGYAQIVDNYGLGDWEIMSSYLAYVIPNHWKYSRALAGNNLGEFAITQVDEDWLEDTMWKIFRIAKHHI